MGRVVVFFVFFFVSVDKDRKAKAVVLDSMWWKSIYVTMTSNLASLGGSGLILSQRSKHPEAQGT